MDSSFKISRVTYLEISNSMQVAKAFFKRDGVFIIENALSPDMVVALNDELKVLHDRKDSDLIVTDDSIRMSRLLSSSPFWSVATDPVIYKLVSHLMSTEPVLGTFSSNSILPNSPGMGRHRDYPYFSLPDNFSPKSMPILALQIVWALNDFKVDNGATFVLADSHNLNSWPTQSYYDIYAKPVLIPSGSAFVFHGALFHSTCPNQTDVPRNGLISGFYPHWVRPFHKDIGVNEEEKPPLTDLSEHIFGQDFRKRIRNDLNKIGYGVDKE